jgi:ABC-type nitrate/sulfonate/bicarbonate transport system permease component
MGIIVIGVVAYAFDLLMRFAERLVVPWKAGPSAAAPDCRDG